MWPKNGIEFYYPPSIMDQIYGVGAELTIEGDRVSRNGISYKKSELMRKVVAQLQRDTPMDLEFERILLKPVEATLGYPPA